MDIQERKEKIRLINCELMEMDCQKHRNSARTDVFEREYGGIDICVEACCTDFRIKLMETAMKRLEEGGFYVNLSWTLTNAIHVG